MTVNRDADSSEIRRVRNERGLSLRQLAERLDVTPAAVQQYEKSEAAGTIRLQTLRKALSAMDADLSVSASLRRRTPDVPTALLDRAPKPHRPKDRVLWRAKNRVRTGAIVADAALEGAPFTPSELWAIVDGATVGGRPVEAQLRVREIRDRYDQMVRRVATADPPVTVITPSGRTLAPDPTVADAFWRALGLAAQGITEGVDPTEARLAANAELLSNGLDSVVLKVNDKPRYDEALTELRSNRNAAKFFQLMLDRYSEDD